MKKFLRGSMIAVLLWLLAASASAEGVVINEVMSRNTLYIPVNNEFAGWIEIKNDSDEPQDITGWYLTDSEYFKDAFRFPETTLAAGEIRIVYAAGVKDPVYAPAWVAPFSVSKGGATLRLTDGTGREKDSVDVPTLAVDEAYSRNIRTGVWEKTYETTPGEENLPENHAALRDAQLVGARRVVISEAMSSNKSYLAAYGSPDWLELHNLEASAIDLTGWHISADPENADKGYEFKNVTLGPDGYLLLIADAENRVDENGTIHVNFKLSATGEKLILTDAEGRMVNRMYFDEIGRDRSISLMSDGTYTTQIAPSPGWPNNDSGAQSARLSGAASEVQSVNEQGLYINEVMAGTDAVNLDKQSYDWVEIVNTSEATIDLSNYGLSNSESRPRKWQFPMGTSIAPGGYVLVALTGSRNDSDVGARAFRAGFSLGVGKGEVLTLCTPQGDVIDKVGLGVQRQNISFGRSPDNDRYVYFETPTPGAPNGGTSYEAIAEEVSFSVQGGIMKNAYVSLSMNAEPGMSIYYTTDCSTPTVNSQLYSGPITLSDNTVVRAVAWRNGVLHSQVATQSYIFNEDTSLRLVSVVADPSSLYGGSGIITNSNKHKNVVANVEVYTRTGVQLVDQGCRMRLSGAGSLKQSQKSMKLIADGKYGSSLFNAVLFDNRDYTSYKSFVLRSSGQDSWKTRMLDSVLTSTLEGTPLLYQETETCVVYVNGKYYGHMNMRERVNAYMMCQFHGWDNPDDLDILENRDAVVVQGSGKSDWQALMKWVQANDLADDANLAMVETAVDVDNYLYYVAFEMFIANNDLGNVRWYRNPKADNKWRWAAYDVDLSWQTDQNSLSRWLKKGGVGTVTPQDNTLFRNLMKNKGAQERFMTILGNLMAENFSTANIQAKIMERSEEIHDDAVKTFMFYGEGSENLWTRHVKRIYNYAATRPEKLLGYIQQTTKYSDSEMYKYFGPVIDAINGVNEKVDDADTYVDEEQVIQENPRDQLDTDSEAGEPVPDAPEPVTGGAANTDAVTPAPTPEGTPLPQIDMPEDGGVVDLLG